MAEQSMKERYEQAWNLLYAKLDPDTKRRVDAAKNQEGRPLPEVSRFIRSVALLAEDDEELTKAYSEYQKAKKKAEKAAAKK